MQNNLKNEDTRFKIKYISYSVFGKKYYHRDLPRNLNFVAKGLVKDELVAAFSQRKYFPVPNFILSAKTPPIEYEIKKNLSKTQNLSKKVIINLKNTLKNLILYKYKK